jgi:hypothetical protein
MGSHSISGHRGEIRWSYLPAVVFGAWKFEGDGKGGTLEAQIVSCDEFRAQQRPLVVVVPTQRTEWRWAVIDLQISGTTLVASVARL